MATPLKSTPAHPAVRHRLRNNNAGRRRGDPLKKYADYFDETVTIEVEIHPEIEWRPPDE
jgi:hypothetical protein